MRRQDTPIGAFRRHLKRLIDEQYDGHWTRLARRAGIPVTTLQHLLYHAKHLPGGEHLLRLAEALGVSVQDLVSGEAPPANPRPPRPIRRPRRAPPGGEVTHVVIPLFRCGCPGACPLTEEGPAMAAAVSRLVLGGDLLPDHRGHRLIGVQVDAGLPCSTWPAGTQLVVDWDARTPPWEALALIQADGRCALGHLTPVGHLLLFGSEAEGEFRVIGEPWRILGTIVAAVVAL
jgi:Cro/C1-type helix-turn-helix DNA-binding protein